MNNITFDEFQKVEIRVGTIIDVKHFLGAIKPAFQLQVDLGKEKRQVVAGIAPIYTPESIIGKQVVLVANLQSTKIRGVESQGMLLAAVRKKELSLLTVDQAINNGTRIS